MRLGLARAIGKCAGSGCKARGAARGGTTGKPCNAADAPAHRSAGTAKYNGCARAKGLANPSGPGRFPLMRRCRLLIGSLPNLVGSALPEGKSAAVAATQNIQTGSREMAPPVYAVLDRCSRPEQQVGLTAALKAFRSRRTCTMLPASNGPWGLQIRV